MLTNSELKRGVGGTSVLASFSTLVVNLVYIILNYASYFITYYMEEKKMKIIYVKKMFKNEKNEEVMYNAYYVYVMNPLKNSGMLVPIKVTSKDKLDKYAIETNALYFDDLISALNWCNENE